MSEIPKVWVYSKTVLSVWSAVGRPKTWMPLHDLRWVTFPNITPHPPQLQQAQRCVETGELRWRAVPTIVSEEMYQEEKSGDT